MAADRVGPFWRAAGLLALAALVAGCSDELPREEVHLQVEKAPDYMMPDAGPDRGPAGLSDAAQSTMARLQDIIESNSLRRLTAFAEAQPGFVSNFAGASHSDHWDLLRRTGFDPILRLEELLAGPYGTKSVAGETWYVWPDLAALEPEALTPERLNFSQRARLEELVGETGIAQIREGRGYPGIRTAIAEDGRWLYYVHEVSGEE
tara:strand:+ start:276 stop:893 length:618 start_codon:yes stop_codon:yes gene_type:complete